MIEIQDAKGSTKFLVPPIIINQQFKKRTSHTAPSSAPSIHEHFTFLIAIYLTCEMYDSLSLSRQEAQKVTDIVIKLIKSCTGL